MLPSNPLVRCGRCTTPSVSNAHAGRRLVCPPVSALVTMGCVSFKAVKDCTQQAQIPLCDPAGASSGQPSHHQH